MRRLNMTFLNNFLLTSVLSLFANDVTMTRLSIVFLCDYDLHEICESALNDTKLELIEVEDIRVELTGIVIRSSGDFIQDVRTLKHTDSKGIILFIAIGNDHVVNAVSCIARAVGVPAIVYSTSTHRVNMFEDGVISIYPDRKGLAQAIITIIGKQMVRNAFVVCQDTLQFDGFMDVFRQDSIQYSSRRNSSLETTISVSDSDLDLRTLLLNVHDNGYRLLIVHSSPELFERLIKIAADMLYFNAGYAWIITEEAMTNVPMATNVTMTTNTEIPKGLLAVDGYEEDKYIDLLKDVINTARIEMRRLLTKAYEYNLASKYMAENFRVVLEGRKDVYNAFIGGIRSNVVLFDSDDRRKNIQYRLLNFIEEHKGNKSFWWTVGYIRGNDLDLSTVVWPGQSIFVPIHNVRAFYSVVTRPADPFVYVRGPTESRDQCAADTACLKVFTVDPVKINYIIENFRTMEAPGGSEYKYEIFCCEGVVVDIIHALSLELEFDFLIYFQDDQNYGTYKNGTWTGMVGDVISGAADIMAGAISITSERMEAISFTEAYYFASFGMVTAKSFRFTSLLAFMNPFHPYVWMMIFVSATCVGVITSLFEWNSPFGLNPWGKRRKKNYTLGSAITMVYSLWFGHTVQTKSPKSWPSKFLQNCWACLSIFVLAAYTANLAAFLAGNANQETTYNILDAQTKETNDYTSNNIFQLYSKRIGVIQTSAAEEHIRIINPNLHIRFKNNYVTSDEDAFFQLRNDKLDLYIDDAPLLEYALSKYDDNCSIKFASHNFGENAYAFGVKKGSWLKKKLDPLVLNLVELGYVENLKWRYMGKNRQCSNSIVSTNKNDIHFDLRHTGGLFVFLLVGIGLAIFLLILEHITYFVILPRLKKKPPDSIWKNRNVEYFSQRLYKSINSEKVEPPAKVLLSKVKKRKFELQNRLKQARSVPADLSSYELRNRRINRILDVAYRGFYEIQNSHGNPDVYTISDSMDDELAEILSEIDPIEYASHRDSLVSLDMLSNSCFENPVFESDNIDIIIENQGDPDNSERCSILREDGVHGCQADVSNGSINSRTNGHVKQNESEERNSGISSLLKNKRYETWPSPKTRQRSVKRSQNNNAKSFSNADTVNMLQSDRIVNEIPTVKCRTCSSTSLDGLVGKSNRLNLNIKDNRLKSNIRSHAMAATERRRSMAFDQGAVEALSKEDLLVLWKRSEIDLQTRLNRMLHQNSHLRRLVQLTEDYQRKSFRKKTKQKKEIRIRKVSNGHIRQVDDRNRKQQQRPKPHERTSEVIEVSDENEDDFEIRNGEECNTSETNLTSENTINIVDEMLGQRSNGTISRVCNSVTKETEEDIRIDNTKDENARHLNNAKEKIALTKRTERLPVLNADDGTDEEDNDNHIMTTRL